MYCRSLFISSGHSNTGRLDLCRYLEWGKAWSFLAGEDTSQTQYAASDDRVHIWNHPIDVHFATASMQGWPRIIMQLWELDEYGRSILSGYGFAHFPTIPGEFQFLRETVCFDDV